MGKIYFTDEMSEYLKRHCSGDYLARCLQGVPMELSDSNTWDITDYILTDLEDVTVVDKMNIIFCFLHKGGLVYFEGKQYERYTSPYLMTELVKKEIVSQQEEADILQSWIDPEDGEPFFDFSDGQSENGETNETGKGTASESEFQLPPLYLLPYDGKFEVRVNLYEQNINKQNIERILNLYGITKTDFLAKVGPTFTEYEVKLTEDVKVSAVRNLTEELARHLPAGSRVYLHASKQKTLMFEIPTRKRFLVPMAYMLESSDYQLTDMELPVALGVTPDCKPFLFDLQKAPHLLITGDWNMGELVGQHAIITSLLYKKRPGELKLVIIDLSEMELDVYAPLSEKYLATLADEKEPIIKSNERAMKTLQSLDQLMHERYQLLRKAGARNLNDYNELFKSGKLSPEDGHAFMPYYVVVVNRFDRLFRTYGQQDVAWSLCRIAQLSRAVGIHLIITTSVVRTEVITGVIKANFPTAVVFKVENRTESLIAVNQPGAERLIGRGDILLSQNGSLVRLQGAYIDTPQVDYIVKYIGKQKADITKAVLPEPAGSSDIDVKEADCETARFDSYFADAARLIVQKGQVSTPDLIRHFYIGYPRANRIVEQLVETGILRKKVSYEIAVTDMQELAKILKELE